MLARVVPVQWMTQPLSFLMDKHSVLKPVPLVTRTMSLAMAVGLADVPALNDLMGLVPGSEYKWFVWI